jgi:hypothetical protein
VRLRWLRWCRSGHRLSLISFIAPIPAAASCRRRPPMRLPLLLRPTSPAVVGPTRGQTLEKSGRVRRSRMEPRKVAPPPLPKPPGAPAPARRQESVPFSPLVEPEP